MRGRPENTHLPDLAKRLKLAKMSLAATDAEVAAAIGLSPASFYRCMKTLHFSETCAARATVWLSQVESGAKIMRPPEEDEVKASLNEIAQKLRETASMVLRLNTAFKKRHSTSNSAKV